MGSGIRKEMGRIMVLYDDNIPGVSYASQYIPGTGLGLDIQADVSGTDIRLMVIVDNTNSNNLSFDATLKHKYHE